jgi:hypothetical protein
MRSQRHLREIRGIDSAGRVRSDSGAIIPGETEKIAFTGTVADVVENQNVLMTPISISTYMIGSDVPFTYAVTAGALPTGITINADTGVISGTPTVIETQAGIVVTATDLSGDTADTNAFEIDVQA